MKRLAGSLDGNTAPANAPREGLATARPTAAGSRKERQEVISWFEFIVFRRDIVVGSLFGGHQFRG